MIQQKPTLTKANPKILLLLLLFIVSLTGFSQSVNFNVTGNAPNNSSGVDVDISNLGLLIPRMPLSSKVSFASLISHISGITVYNIETTGGVTPGHYFNYRSKCVAVIQSGITSFF